LKVKKKGRKKKKREKIFQIHNVINMEMKTKLQNKGMRLKTE
jgi:hypothetical protein